MAVNLFLLTINTNIMYILICSVLFTIIIILSIINNYEKHLDSYIRYYYFMRNNYPSEKLLSFEEYRKDKGIAY